MESLTIPAKPVTVDPVSAAITLYLELQDHKVPAKPSLYYIIVGTSIIEIHLFQSFQPHFNPFFPTGYFLECAKEEFTRLSHLSLPIFLCEC